MAACCSDRSDAVLLMHVKVVGGLEQSNSVALQFVVRRIEIASTMHFLSLWIAAIKFIRSIEAHRHETIVSKAPNVAVVVHQNKIGVLWSNQVDSAFHFAAHVDGQGDGTWSATETAYSGPLVADDHINLKTDSAGRVYAAIKTSQTASASWYWLCVR